MYISKKVNLYLLVHLAVMTTGLTCINVSSESWWETGIYAVVLIIILYFFYRDLKNHREGREYRYVQERVHNLFDALTKGNKQIRATDRSNGMTYILFYQPTERIGLLKLRRPETRWVVEAEYPRAYLPDENHVSIVREIGFRLLGSVTFSTQLVGFDENGEGKYHESSTKLSMKQFHFLLKTPAAMYLSLEEILAIESILISIPHEDWSEASP